MMRRIIIRSARSVVSSLRSRQFLVRSPLSIVTILPPTVSTPLRSYTHLSGLPRRGLFIQTQETPNPLALKFVPGRPVIEDGSSKEYYADKVAAHSESPLAKALFKIEGVSTVFLGSDFVSVSIRTDGDWALIKPEVFSSMMDFFSGSAPVLNPTTADMDPSLTGEEDSEVVQMIKELIETRIRPAIQGDGGDIVLMGFNPDDGIVKVQLQGSCVGCPSSTITLKNGIETMLMRYIPEVQGVENVETEFDEISNEALRQLEEGLEKVQKQRAASTADK